MGEIRNAYEILTEIPEGNRPFGRPRRRWKGNIKMGLTEMGREKCGLGSSDSGNGPVEGLF